MRSLSFSLQRMFWSAYGSFVWDERKAPWRAPQVQRIVGILQSRQAVPGERVLDAGCGTGHYAVALARAGFCVTGIDYAAGMLDQARVKVTADLSDVVSFQQADLNARLPFPDAHFDHAINVSVLQVMADPAFALGELWRLLKLGGTLVLLHVPRPASHDLPLWEAIKYRVAGLEARTPWRMALVAVKAWAERAGSARYWTATELEEMLAASWFDVLLTDSGPPIVIVAEKSKS